MVVTAKVKIEAEIRQRARPQQATKWRRDGMGMAWGRRGDSVYASRDTEVRSRNLHRGSYQTPEGK